MDEITPSTIHAELAKVLTGNETAHHYSDLYVKQTTASKAIVDKYQYKNQVSVFTDQITKTPWYDIPFAYNPEYKNSGE